MNTRTSLLACALAGLSLALLPVSAHADPPLPASAASDTPAVAVVQEFLADRAAGRYDAAYMLLSAGSRQQITKELFTAGSPIPVSAAHDMPASAFGLFVLLGDTHNTLNYTLTVIGPDPMDPRIVLIRAVPPAGNKDLSAATLSLLTVSDPAAHTSRLDVFDSLKRAAPQQFARARGNAEQTTSLSNLKQLSLGVIQYTQDHDEIMPDADKWVDEIMPYVKSEALFHDPSAPASEKWSYAYNRTLSHKPLAQFAAPADTVMLFESNLGAKNASDTGQSVPRPGRHSGGTDYALTDGHVKWYPDGTKLSYRLDGK